MKPVKNRWSTHGISQDAIHCTLVSWDMMLVLCRVTCDLVDINDVDGVNLS